MAVITNIYFLFKQYEILIDTLLSKLLLFVDSDFVTMALDCDLILMIVFFTINIIFCVSTEQQQ